MKVITQIETVIKKLIMPQYPELIKFEVQDLFADEIIDYWLETSYTVEFETSECLDSKKQMEIDTDVKSLFKMLSPDKKLNRDPEISCFFDCGDGEGFNFSAEYGYKH
jgi:hypothetical protein